MNLLLEIILQNGFVLDVFGIIGLGLLGLAAVHISRRQNPGGGRMVAWSAVALIVGRFLSIVLTQIMSPQLKASFGPVGGEILVTLPAVLLTLGLGGIVWGLWDHEKALASEA